MNEKAINANIAKYKVLKLLAYLLVVAVGIIALIINTPIASCVAVMFIITWSNFVPKKFIPKIFKKYIEPLLLYAVENLDGPLYAQTVKASNINSSDAIYRMCGEYYTGNYQAVVDICTQCLADEKLAFFKYHYYIYLANCYFEIGDDEKLKEVCDVFSKSVENEANKERLLKNFPVMTFFEQYLNGDFDKCLEITNEHSDSKATRITRAYRKARILMQTGKTDDAKTLFETVKSDAPKSNYAILATHGIDAIEKGIPYSETFETITPSNEELPELKNAKKKAKTGKILTSVAIICFAAIFVFSIFNYTSHLENGEGANLVEEIRLLAEEKYDGVEVVDVFNLEMDGKIIDSMFLCKTDKNYILGSMFNFTDDKDKALHISIGAEFDIEFDTADTLFKIVPTVNEYYLAEVVFCKHSTDIPTENQHSSVISVNGKDVYFTVTGALENPLYPFLSGAN